MSIRRRAYKNGDSDRESTDDPIEPLDRDRRLSLECETPEIGDWTDG